MITTIIILLLIVGTAAMGIRIIPQTHNATIERLGKFSRVITPGFHLIIPGIEQTRMINIQQQESDTDVQSKTQDDVFVDLKLAIQYRADPDAIKDAVYKLSNPIEQMESYIYDVVRSTIPKLPIDEVFSKKEEIQTDINAAVKCKIKEFGYILENVLVTDIKPDSKVQEAMNRKNAALRDAETAKHEAEAKAVLVIRAAEAKAEADRLYGKGLADQRRELVKGYKISLDELKDADGSITGKDSMDFLLTTQQIDAQVQMAGTANAKVIFSAGVNTSGKTPTANNSLRNNIIEGNEAS